MSESLPGDAAGPKQYNETGEGSVIATRKGNAAKPAAEALQPATTFRWEAWRHDSLYSWLPPIKRQLSIQGACSDPSGNSKPLCILDGGEQNRIFSVVANGNVTFTNIEFRGGSTRSLAPEDPTSSEVMPCVGRWRVQGGTASIDVNCLRGAWISSSHSGICCLSQDLEVEHLGSAILMDYLSAGSFTSCVFNFNEANRNVPVSGVSGGLGPNRVLGPGAGGALGLQGSLRVLVISSIFKNNSATMVRRIHCLSQSEPCHRHRFQPSWVLSKGLSADCTCKKELGTEGTSWCPVPVDCGLW